MKNLHDSTRQECYETPSATTVTLTPDRSFLQIGSGTVEDYDPSQDYGGEWN